MDIIELIKELIKFRSTSYHELELMNYIKKILEKKGISLVFDRYNPSKYLDDGNVYPDTANIYVSTGNGKDALVLYAHTDVVEAKDNQFNPTINGNLLYGRGASDMKSALAGLLINLIENYDYLMHLEKRIIFSFISDEENSGTGARQQIEWLKKQNLDSIKCILFEPSDDFKTIHIGGRGYIFLDVDGEFGSLMGSLIRIFSKQDELIKRYKMDQKGFELPSIQITSIHSENFKNYDLSKIRIESGKSCHASTPYLGINALSKLLKKCPEHIISISTYQNPSNVVPEKCGYVLGESNSDILMQRCKACIDIRTNFNADLDDSILKDILNLINKDLNVRIRDRGHSYLNMDNQLLNICKSAVDYNVTEEIAQGGSDAGYYSEVTDNIIGGFGPGSLKVAHTISECVDLDVLRKTPGIIFNIIKNLKL